MRQNYKNILIISKQKKKPNTLCRASLLFLFPLTPARLTPIRVINAARNLLQSLHLIQFTWFHILNNSRLGLLLHREFDGIGSGFGTEVIHARLQALLPRIKVHRSQLAEVGILYK